MYPQHHPGHPYPMRYNPYRYNPLSLPAKIAIGVAVVGGVGVGAWLLWPREAKAGAPPDQPQPPPPPPPGPSPKPGGRPSGHPSPYGKSCYPPGYGGSNRYDTAYWDAGGTSAARARIFEAFEELGYQTPTDRDTMNHPGADGELGGEPDVPNEEVRRFQRDYNAVSRSGQFVGTMGGLDMDGLVGPCTLNALKLVLDNLGDRDWPDVVAAA